MTLDGPGTVRMQLARRLAAALDDPDTPRYVVPRLSSELRAVVAELEAVHGHAEEREQARRILAEVTAA